MTVEVDGSFGEGGGQIVRTSLALAAITGRGVRLRKIRVQRRSPGLAPQHLAAVRAVGAVCGARVAGDRAGAQDLEFEPAHAPRAADYEFEIGTAGAATLVLQALLPALARADGASTVVIRGGTHVPLSPPFDYARDVWLPLLERLGVHARIELERSGWYPAGGGELRAFIDGAARPEALTLRERGALLRVTGRAVAANLPAHIPQRMAARASSLLRAAGIDTRIDPERVRAASPGAGIFLAAHYEACRAGFSVLGERGKPSELVAEQAADALLAHRESGAPLEPHLADQILPFLAQAERDSVLSVQLVTPHLTTNAWVLERFGLGPVEVEGSIICVRGTPLALR